jgi:hypothetical protein
MMEHKEKVIMAEAEERANKALIDKMTSDIALIPANIKRSTWDQHVEILKLVKGNQNKARKKRNKREQKSILKEKKELEESLAEASGCKKQKK